jgi:hypothetical protein
MRNRRRHSSIIIRKDYRGIRDHEAYCELQGTSYGFNYQNNGKLGKVVCRPSDVKWQLRINPMRNVANRDQGLRSGVNLSLSDFIAFVKHPQMDALYNKVYRLFPLTEDYYAKVRDALKYQSEVCLASSHAEVAQGIKNLKKEAAAAKEVDDDPVFDDWDEPMFETADSVYTPAKKSANST